VDERSITVQSGEHRLVGTLTTPAGDGPFPAVLLLPGSGPVDRNSDHKRMPLGITRELAQALDAAGLATFRYDKRGVGESTGSWRAVGLHDNIADARAALATLTAASDVDPRAVFAVGHSEGALLAGALAAGDTPLAGVVLLSASATPGEELLRWQAAQIAPTLPTPVRLLLRLLRTDLEKKVAANHVKIKATTTDVARVDGARINARWSREFMAYDPRADLTRITVPVLAITGAKDLQVDPADLDTIVATVQGPVQTHVIPDVSHILRGQAGPATLRSYGKDLREPVDTRLVSTLVDWLERRLAAAR
jgi:uncharacterized protein